MYSYEIAWCFHQPTYYTPDHPKDWDLDNFTSNFYSFKINYNVWDKCNLLWGDSGQVILAHSDSLELELSFKFFLVLPASLNIFPSKLFS